LAYAKKSIVCIENGVLRIKKHKQSQWILLLVMLWPFVINLIAGLPSPLSCAQYLCDGIMLCWCFGGCVGLKYKSTKMRRNTTFFLIWICIFVGYTLVTYGLHYQSALYYLWGIRNNFRGYMLFFRVLLQANKEDVDEWLGVLDSLFWLNAVLTIFQFVVMGIKQDYLGGIFGTGEGMNGFTLIFLSIVVVKSQLNLYEHKEKLWVCLLKCAVALLIAAMAELKFYLLLFVFQMVLVVILTQFSWKKVIVLPICAIAVSASMGLLAQWFSSSGTFDIGRIIAKAFEENYASANDLNRLSAIGTLSRRIVKNPLDRIVGLGLGNCDSANFAFLRTPFYERYSYLHYKWFSAPMIFLETGYIGLVFFLGFFMMCLIKTIKNRQRRKDKTSYNSMGIIFSITALILAFYNASLRYEAGWMIYVVLTLPFISTKKKPEKGVVYENMQRNYAEQEILDNCSCSFHSSYCNSNY